jgi:peptidoglycan hydrolase CwlO-like protein
MKLLHPALCLLLATAVLGCSDDSGRSVDAVNRLREGAAQTLDSLRDLTIAQKDQFVARAREQLDALDAELDELRKDTSAAAAQRLVELERKRQELAPRFEALRAAGADAWDDVKDGFLAGYEDLREAVAEPTPK